MKDFIITILCTLAAILVIGSVGAFEQEVIGFGQCLIQSIIGCAVIYLCVLIHD